MCFGNSILLGFGTAILVRYTIVLLVLGTEILVGSAHKYRVKSALTSHNWDPAPLGFVHMFLAWSFTISITKRGLMNKLPHNFGWCVASDCWVVAFSLQP